VPWLGDCTESQPLTAEIGVSANWRCCKWSGSAEVRRWSD